MANQFSAPLRVAVIGTGYFSQFHINAWQRMPDVQLVGLTSLDIAQAHHTAKAHEIEAFDDVSTLLKNTQADLIDIVVPPSVHAKLIRQCIEFNKWVVCQKPFGASVEEASQLTGHIKQADARVVVHENFRFQPWYQAIKAIVDDGRLGQLYEVNFDFRPGDGQGNDAYLERQPYFQKQTRFLIQETGVHYIDVFRYLFGDIKGLFAHLQKLNPAIAGEDAGVVIMEFQSGMRGVLNANRLTDHAAQNRRLTMGEMRVEGSNGTLQLDGDGRIFLRDHASNERHQHHYEWKNTDFGGDCVFNTNRHIADHLLYQQPLQNDAASYLINRTIEQAIYESSEKQCWIALQKNGASV